MKYILIVGILTHSFVFSQNNLSNSELLEAIKLSTIELEKNPNNKLYLNARGDSYFFLEQFDLALEDYIKLSSLGKDKDVYYRLGLTFKEIGKYQAAIRNFSYAIDMDKLYYNAYIGRGNSNYENKSFKEAINDYNLLLALKPSRKDSIKCYLGLGSTYLKLEEFEQSEKYLMLADSIEKENPYVYLYFSELFVNIGDKEKGCNYFLLAKEYGLTIEDKLEKETINKLIDICK